VTGHRKKTGWGKKGDDGRAERIMKNGEGGKQVPTTSRVEKGGGTG